MSDLLRRVYEVEKRRFEEWALKKKLRESDKEAAWKDWQLQPEPKQQVKKGKYEQVW